METLQPSQLRRRQHPRLTAIQKNRRNYRLVEHPCDARGDVLPGDDLFQPTPYLARPRELAARGRQVAVVVGEDAA